MGPGARPGPFAGGRVTGVVFMGMGEPFLNYERVRTAARVALLPLRRRGGGRAITVSTVGLVPEIDRFTAEGHKYRLSISLGAATDAKRARLVPVAARTPVAEVMAAARRHAQARRARHALLRLHPGRERRRGRRPGARRLIGDTPVRFDLIDVTDPSGRFEPPTDREMDAVPRRPEPPPRPAGRPALLGRQGHPGRLRDPRHR